MDSRFTKNFWILQVVPAGFGLGIAWLGVTLIKNERKLLYRRLELEAALDAKTSKERKKLLSGN